ncbi:MAG TPA: efflux RND transporter permease subunit [Candidatus Hydrogenedentes bacterium]|nr:efflux RND transporter permease subunit [Candidatus Hydrogenedentota bacterium]
MNETKTEQPETSSRFALRRPVTVVMIFLTIAVFGLRSYQQIPINLMPNISYPTLTVRTEFEGAAPEDVEKLITRPLEEMLSVVGGLVEISSVSSAGLSEIVLEFAWGTNMTLAQQDVRDRLDLFEPPREVTKKPVILRYDPNRDPVIRLAIRPPNASARTPEELNQQLIFIRDAAERHLKSDLEAEGGIAQVLVKGGQEEEIQVLVDAEKLKALGLSLQFLVEALAQQNVNLSGGQLREGKTEYLVRTLNEFTAVEEIAAMQITLPTGGQKRLSDLAEVRMGAKDRESIVRMNGAEAVALDIYKEGDANTVAVCNRIKDLLDIPRKYTAGERMVQLVNEKMAEINARSFGKPKTAADALQQQQAKRTFLNRLPKGVQLSVISDQSRFIRASIDEVQDAILQGGLFSLIVLFLFLRELKSTLIIGIAIPLSVIATFVPMYLQGITLNIMSLGGLALGVGMLVDNSIVVLESIFRCREEGDDLMTAADRGTQEVSGAVIASTLTTVCVFFPIAFVQGIAGQLFKDLALSVTFSLLASLLTAMYLVPLMVSRRMGRLQSTAASMWLVRAWKESRESGKSPAGALLSVPVKGMSYAMEGIRNIAVDLMGPSWRKVSRVFEKASVAGRLKSFLSGITGLITLPLMAALTLLQIALSGTGAVAATFTFFALAILFGVFLLIRLLARITLTPLLYLFNAGFNGLRNLYRVTLRQCLPRSSLLLLPILGLAVHAGITAGKLGRELIPPMKQGEFSMRMEMRAGTRLEDTERATEKFEQIFLAHPEVDSVAVEVGKERSSGVTQGGENIARFTITLKDPDRTTVIQDQILESLRQQVLAVARGEELTFSLPSLFTFKTALEIQLYGENQQELRRVGERALEVIKKVPGVADAELSVKPGYPELIIELDRELLAARGISPGQIAQRLRNEIQGNVATRFSRAGEKLDIRVRTDKSMLASVEDLRKLSVTDGPVPVPLSAVARIEVREGPSEIRRMDQKQVVIISANVEDRDLGAVSQDIETALRTVDKPEDFYFALGGQNRELNTAYKSLQFALLLALFLVYVVMASQFESLVQPALVMFSVPLAFVGVIYALYYTGTNLSVMVFLGGIVLAGIVVNNAIVLVDYTNQLQARGMDKRDAIVLAGTVRLRPILMTTLTTVLGLIPMLLATGEGSEIRRPMAITVMAGLSSSTLLTLFVIPMVYELFGSRRRQ